jgi:hypothetical protein
MPDARRLERGDPSVRARMERVAATPFTVLIEASRASARNSSRGRFTSCRRAARALRRRELRGDRRDPARGGAVRHRGSHGHGRARPAGKFEHAHEGTLFLDEVGDLSLAAQAKLLRAVQEMSVERVGGFGARPVDTRIIAATNQSLSDLVARGRFRLDLFHRLAGVEIIVPPCAIGSRTSSSWRVLPGAASRIPEAAVVAGVGGCALAYTWPGNVRELQRVIERAVAMADSDQLRLEDLPPTLLDGYTDVLMPSMARQDSMRAWGSRYARMVVERCGTTTSGRRAASWGFRITRCSRISGSSRIIVPGCLRRDGPAQARRDDRRGARRDPRTGGVPW